jgi:DNA (cytosine-5)-methyltransferase 1
MQVASIFSGIGGFEVGLEAAGHTTRLLCEIEPGALSVLRHRVAGEAEICEDVTELRRIPPEVDLLVAGFPCINLSLAGYKQGIEGPQSSLVRHVFRLLERKRVGTIVLENVPFMLHLNHGDGMLILLDEFERLGYRWAYRVVDALGFGLPQRRERVFLIASRDVDPAAVLFADNHELGPAVPKAKRRATGFYWTEGVRGLGWADEALPTLKGGSTIGIASPPAIWVEGEGFYLPDIRDAERMQGFEAGWTEPAEAVARSGHRWKLVGNAVSTRAAEWIGRRLLSSPSAYDGGLDWSLDRFKTLPRAAWSDGVGRFGAVRVTRWAAARPREPLLQWLKYPLKPLSLKAGSGLLERTSRSKLRFRAGFLEDLNSYVRSQQRKAVAS